MSKTLMNKRLISTFVVLIMVLSVFIVISPNATAQPTSVGTVTLNPATGAYPGQLVYFTWSNVPSTLVSPVSVTVWVNNTPYQVVSAVYSGTTLTGSFVMPNENPGSSINLAFSYKDSASATAYAKMSSDINGTLTSTMASLGSTGYEGGPVMQGMTYSVLGNVSKGTNTTTTASTTTVTGSQSSLQKLTGTLAATSFTTLSNTSSQSFAYSTTTNYSTPGTLSGYGNAAAPYLHDVNLTVSATTYNAGPIPIASPSSLPVNTVFNVTNSSSFSINYFTTSFYYNTTVAGTNVSVYFTGSYNFPITANGTYTLIGSFTAIKPSSLVHNLTGAWSGTYKMTITKAANKEVTISYTLSLTTTTAKSPDNVVSFQISYSNNTATSVSTGTKTGTFNIDSAYSVSLTSGTFTSKAIGIMNPYFKGVYSFIISGYGVSANFSYNVPLSTNTSISVIGSTTSFVMKIPISILALNQTITGTLQINISTIASKFSDGVAFIADGNWGFTLSQNFTASNTHISIVGSSVATTQKFPISSTVSFNTSVPEVLNIPTYVNLTTLLGYPELTSVTVDKSSFVLSYGTLTNSFSVSSATISPDMILSSKGSTYKPFYTNQTVTGFNVTLAGNIGSKSSTELNFTVNAVGPAVYGFTKVPGYLNLTITYSASFAYSTFIKLTMTNTHSAENNTTFANVYNAVSNAQSTGLLSETATLNDISASVNYNALSAATEAQFFGYTGSIQVSGNANNTTKQSLSSLASSEHLYGLVSSVSGVTVNLIQNTSYFNATESLTLTSPALFGVPTFTGLETVTITGFVQTNVSKQPSINETLSYTADFVIQSTLGNYTVKNSSALVSGAAKLTDKFTEYNIDNFSISGYIPALNEYGYNTSLPFMITPGNNTTLTPTLTSYGSVALTIDITPTYTPTSYFDNYYPSQSVTLHYVLGAPAANVTLSPVFGIFNTTFSFGYEYYNETSYTNEYYPYIELSETGTMLAQNVAFTGAVAGAKVSFSGTGMLSGLSEYNYWYSYTYGASLLVPVSIFGESANVAINPVSVGGESLLALSGTVTGLGMSGTASGWLQVTDYNLTNFAFTYTGQLFATGVFANGTAFSLELNLTQNTVLPSLVGPSAFAVPIVATTNIESVSGAANTGEYVFGPYNVVWGGELLSIENGVAKLEIQGNNTTRALGSLNLQIVDVSGAMVTLQTNLGFVQTSLNTIMPVIMSISNTTMSISTLVGTINMNVSAFHTETMTALNNGTVKLTGEINGVNTTMTSSLAAMGATITALNGTMATVNTTFGSLKTSISSIDATVTSINGNVATISTSLGTLTGTVTSINGTVATIKTNLGTLTTTVSGLKTTSSNTSTSVGNTMIFEIVVLVLILVTLALVAYTIGQVRKQGPKKPEEIKAPEEEKKE